MEKEFDVVVFGATGFTGSLVAEYLHSSYGTNAEVRWAMVGRSASKLAEVRDRIGAPKSLQLLFADAADAAALEAIARRARVIITTVGPYQWVGEPLLAACARCGTDYVDLCGEPGWMAQMIAKYQTVAQASGARIVFSCGFDSIPFGFAIVYLQEQARRRWGSALSRVRGRVRAMNGTVSGGTVASLLATLEAQRRDPSLAQTLANPFALVPGFKGPDQPGGDAVVYDEVARSWLSPFVMATINTKNVHRTNALLGFPYGQEFLYDEMVLDGDGPAGKSKAMAHARTFRLQMALLGFAPTRALLRRFVLPKPGQGPGRRAREAGNYDILVVGEGSDGQTLRVSVKGDKDPGYGSTCKMLAESALCLVQDMRPEALAGGIWTPGAAFGMALVQRLQDRAGLSFSTE
ncbi:MAG: saccharopine dehydrogenase NADP-binding domain-containing protein [Rhodoferax sp.]|nr:saccharopine dehydrogenase NADP-binding domain-containing protein [Rhodoferax sp.]